MRIVLPEPVAGIYAAVEELKAMYPGMPFTPDGHMDASIGELVAAEALGITLNPPSKAIHDAYDAAGDVQIKVTADSLFRSTPALTVVVLSVVSPAEAKVVYDGSGQPAWDRAGKMQKNGQRQLSLFAL
ncbi:DUF6998 domain-containing protein [Sphingomonas floccifaciens]|uniref:DUF6998 domain-containing protein n=1 Tax=Sphingomonas floccifaciens TaxID=1844115 RepID=A0ABW4N9M8_9SPHN